MINTSQNRQFTKYWRGKNIDLSIRVSKFKVGLYFSKYTKRFLIIKYLTPSKSTMTIDKV